MNGTVGHKTLLEMLRKGEARRNVETGHVWMVVDRERDRLSLVRRGGPWDSGVWTVSVDFWQSDAWEEIDGE